MTEIINILNETGIPYAYDHFAEGESPDPPFICYLNPATDNFVADGIVYLSIDEINIELYTDKKDPEIEQKLEQIMKQHGIVWNKDETWIPDERLYEVIYDFEVRSAPDESEEDESA